MGRRFRYLIGLGEELPPPRAVGVHIRILCRIAAGGVEEDSLVGEQPAEFLVPPTHEARPPSRFSAGNFRPEFAALWSCQIPGHR